MFTIAWLAIAFVTLAVSGCQARSVSKTGPGVAASNAPYKALVAASVEELKAKTAAHEQLFQIGQADWEVDQDAGTITITSPSGVVATAPVQIGRSLNKADSTWLWAWDNSSVDAKFAEHSTLAREYGDKNRLPDVTTNRFATAEDKCWKFAAMTCKLGNHQNAYRGPADDTLIFFTFGEVKERMSP